MSKFLAGLIVAAAALAVPVTADGALVTGGEITKEALGTNPVVVTYPTPSTTDDGSMLVAASVSCTPASGGSFAVGTTPVSCTGLAVPSLTENGSFNVNILPGAGPTFIQPANVVAYADPGKTSTVVSYPAPTASDPSGVSSLACKPASGSAFPLGNTLVRCDAKDGVGNPSAAGFYVTVANSSASNQGGGNAGSPGARAAILSGPDVYVVKKGRTQVEVACAPDNATPCAGVTTFIVRLTSGKSASGQLVTLGGAKFNLAPGKSQKLGVKISRTGQKLLARLKRFSALQQASTHDTSGRELRSSRVVTLKQAKVTKKRHKAHM